MNIAHKMAPQRRFSLLAKFVLTILFVITFRPFSFAHDRNSNPAAPLPDLSITKTTDGAEPTTGGVFRIALPGSTTFTEAITVNYVISGTATAGTDYTIAATVVIPAGQNGVNLPFTVTDDKIIEGNETAIVTLTGGTSATNGPFPVSATNSSATATIADNDNNTANKVISIVNTTNSAEPGTNGVFTASLPAGFTVAEDVTITYTIAGTATGGTDYTTLTGSVTLPANQNSVTIPVIITDDKIIESFETVIVTVSGGTSATFGAFTAGINKTATNNITDDDNIAANKVISILKNTDPAEPGTDGSFTVSLPTGFTVKEDVTVTYTVIGTATSGTDFTAIGTSVKILAGNNSATVNVPVLNDNIVEGTETVVVTVTGGSSATLGTYTAGTTKVATLNIADDDNIAANKIISIVKNTDASEPATNGSFIVSLPAGITVKENVTVTFNTTGSTATSGSDYTNIGTTVTIPANNNSVSINVNVVNENLIENTESVIVTMTAASSANLNPYTIDAVANTATVTISDDDNTAANKVISITKTDGAEPTTAGSFRVTLPTGITAFEPITVSYTVAGTATPGTGKDYTALTGTTTIPAGANGVNIAVAVLDDKILEGNETVIATLTGATSPTIGTYTISTTNNEATVTITDNDDVAANKILGIVTTTPAAEPATNGVFTISFPTGVAVVEDVTVTYTVTGTALNGTDYASLSGTVVIPANQNKITLPITVMDDIIIENTETVIVSLDAASSNTYTGYTINTGTPKSASANITDNDNVTANKIVSIVKTTDASEPATSGLFTVSLPAGVTVKEDITVNFNVAATSSATSNTDYTALAGTSVKILAGNNSATISLDVLDDNILEGNEIVIVNITSATAPSTGTYTVSATSKQATLTIADDENIAANKILSIVKNTDAAEPATDGLLTISLPPGITAKENITVNFDTPGGTALSGTDYLPFSTGITIPAGQTSVPVPLYLFDDKIIEGTENAVIIITGGSSLNIGAFTASPTDNQVTVTITDDDDVAANKIISIVKDADAAEPGTDGQYTVSLPAGVTTTEDVTITYTATGTAAAGIDYTSLSGTVTIPAGSNNATIALTVLDDKIIEGSENITVTLQGGTSPVYGTYSTGATNSQATITLSDDDNVSINKITSIFKATDGTEPATSGTFTVNLPPGITVIEDVTVYYTATGTATSGLDYFALPGSVVIPAGQNSATITVNVVDDSFLEGTETVIATLNGGTSASFGTFPFTGANGNATVNIGDDDNIPANKMISIVKSTDAFEPSSSGSFTVSLPPGVTVGEAVMVDYVITGTATSGTDFTALTGTVKINAGSNSATIAVNIIDDMVIEPNETIIATVTGGTSPTVGTYTANPAKKTATVIITDDDDIAANKVVSLVKTNDASEPASNGNFTISLPAGVSVAENVEVTYTVSGDAFAGVDYTTLTGTVIIPAGQNSVLLPVKVADDKIIEAVETVSVVIDAASSVNFTDYTIDPVNNSGTVNINDNDNTAANKVISIVLTTNAAEPSANGSYTVRLPTGITVTEDVTVNYTLSGTAIPGTDYTALTGTVVIPAGQNSALIAVNVLDDKNLETTETVIATITNGSSATYGTYTASTTAGQATVNITDNDNITANKVISIVKTADAAEPATNGSFTVSLPAGVTVTVDVTMNYTFSGNATNGTDYAALTGSVIIPAGQNSALIPVTIIDDKVIEGTELFTATLTAGTSTGFGAFSASTTNKTATVTITDDDNIAANKMISIVNTTDASEPATNGSFTVSFPTGVTVRENVTVNYTIAGTASPLNDYVSLSGTVTIPAGQNGAAINVNVTDDNIIEGDETVTANLTGATSTNFTYTVSGQATVTIADDENTAAKKTVSIVKTTDAAEPNVSGRFTVSLPAGVTSPENITVNYTVAGTAGVADYAPLSGTVTIPAGQNGVPVNVMVIDDGMIEGDETVIATLTTATATNFTYTASGQATLTVADDDDLAANKVISISTAANASEPANNGGFTVSLPSGITATEAITVTYTIAGTAGNTDYTALTGSVIIPAGQNNISIDVIVTDDNIIEGNETVIATTTAATGTNFTYTTAGQATVTIADNDNTAANKVISIVKTTDASEPGTNGLFTVRLPAGITATEDITVTYTVAGTATAADYTALSGIVTIPAGQNSAPLNVNVTDDNIIEGAETVIATLSAASSASFTFTANTTATVSIADDDNTTANKIISIVKTADAAEPGTNGLFTLSLPAGITATENITVNYTVAGTAGNTDYSAFSGSVSIPAGSNSATINVNVTDDNVIEGVETVIATLSSATSASFTFSANTAATVSITDDDDVVANKEISIVKTMDAAEPGTNGQFTVSLPAGIIIGEDVTVNYTIAGTAGNTDYTALTGSVIIPAGVSSAAINVNVINDNIIEGNETVIVTVTAATSANFSYTINTTDNATLQIADDDDIAANKVISIVKTQDASEPAVNGRFSVSLPAGITLTEDVTVSYSVSGTANNTDYTALSGTVNIPAGSNSAPVDVNVTDDVTIEGAETVIATLTGATSANYTFTANTQATVTITDDDNMSVISIVKTTDAAEPATNGRYTVSLPAGVTIPEDITVSYTVTGTAGSADYTALTGTVIIKAGDNSAVIDVNVTDDNIVEGTETVITTLTAASSANFTYSIAAANSSATADISDDDNTAANKVISIVKTTDAAEPATNGVFTVRLPAGITLSENITVNYTVAGTAASTDYTALSGSVVIAAGTNSAVINVSVTDDKIIEGNETVTATVTAATSANFSYTIDAANSSATVDISDDDNIAANKVISIVKTTDAAEPATNGVFTVGLPAGITMTEDVTVNYTVTGTATATDYTALSGTATIAAGTNNTTISVVVTDDNLIEGNETVIATLTAATSANYTYTATAQATLNIADNDNTMQISIVKTTDASEPAGDGSFTVSLPMGLTTTEDVTVNYTVAGTATAGADYAALTGSVIIPAGMNGVPILVDVMDDAAVEGAETVIVTITGGTSAIFTFTAHPTNNKATVIISDNDVAAVPRVISIVKTQDASEPATNGSFTVSLDAAVTENMTVNYTVAGTATAGTDYSALGGSVTILSGQTSAAIPVTVIDDIAIEGNETVIVTVTGGTSANFTYTLNTIKTATVNISDNDVAAVPRVISIVKTQDASEPATNGSFTVSLDAAVTENMTVNYTVAGTATGGTDYSALSGSVTILSGQTSAVIPVNVIDDIAIETNETVVVTVTGGTSANFTYTLNTIKTATLNISDNDVPAVPNEISIFTTVEAAEPTLNGEFTLSLNNVVPENVTVNYTVAGTATAGTDYSSLSGTVIIPAGQTTAAIPVNVIDDISIEANETVIVTVTGATSANFTYTIGTQNSATVTIGDDDNTAINKGINVFKTQDAAEPFTHGEFVVFVQSIPNNDLTVNYTISGTAKSGTDYQMLSGSVQIPAGANSINIPVYVTDNLIVDGTREVRITITGGSDGTVTYVPGTNSTAVLEITDNDVLTTQFETWKIATLTAGDADGKVEQNELITYTIFVRNISTAAISQITVADAVPANTEYVSGGTPAGTDVNFSITNLQPGAVQQVSFVVKTVNDLSGVNEIRNTAYVTDGTVNLPTFACDPKDFSCNTGTVTIVPVLYTAVKGDLSISKSVVDPVGPYIIGKTISYKIVVKNEKQTTFTNLVITDELPAGLELPTNYDADKGITTLSTASRKVICTVDQLLPGETVTMTITCKILVGDEIQNVAYVTAAEPEETLVNNRAVSAVKTAGGDLYFITAFRPGAVVNGKFTIVGLEKYPGSRLTVFDRWGSIAFKSENYQNNWTGANAAIGVYLYVVEVRKPEGVVVYKGTVTIIK